MMVVMSVMLRRKAHLQQGYLPPNPFVNERPAPVPSPAYPPPQTAAGRVQPPSARYFVGFLAMIMSLILSYVACGRIFFDTNWVFIAYGRPAMIFAE